MKKLIIKKSKIGQFPNGKGVFANKNFKKGEIVIKYNLKPLTKEEYKKLPKEEKMFTHKHWGQIYIYPIPARYVNHSLKPNTVQNLKEQYDFALRDIKKGEEITTDATKDDIQ
ncbi:SET domain-containing protein [Candidatus Woesearchaeota archaeon]|nr:SET domain-containing protein [Candidatus Woesearchaeota archaeon]